MRRHIPVLAEAFRFYGAFVWCVTAAVALLMTTMAAGLGVVEGLGPAAALMIPAVFAVLGGGIVGAAYRRVGTGLHAHRPWARYVAVVLSVMVLGDLPFGLPLGLLGLGVLLDADAAGAFEGPTEPEAPERVAEAPRPRQHTQPRQVA
jgi:hypothetical protein